MKIEILSKILVVISTIFFIISIYSAFKQRSRLSVIFSIICFCMGVYVLGYSFELMSKNLEQIKFFLKLEYLGLSFMPAFWLIFAYKFYFNKNIPYIKAFIILLIPVITLFFVVTNEYHNLYYSKIYTIKYNNYTLAAIEKGIWYKVFITYSYVALISGISAFYYSWRKSLNSRKIQSFIMMIGAIVPFTANIVYIMGFTPKGFDITAFGMIIVAILYFFAIFKYDFLEAGEVVREISFEHIKEGIIVIDNKNRIVDFNNAASYVFPWLFNHNIGESILSFPQGEKILCNSENSFVIRIDINDKYRYYKFQANEISEKKRIKGRLYIFEDITEEKRILEELNHFAYNDFLCSIYNRRKFMEEAIKEFNKFRKYGKSISALLIDIDFFKKVNDTYGHFAGDEVLKATAKLCKDNLRVKDIIGRYGGEEFVIILSQTNREEAFNIADGIRKLISENEIVFGENTIKVTVSIGVSYLESTDKEKTLEEMLNEADKALYMAKASGRNRVC